MRTWSGCAAASGTGTAGAMWSCATGGSFGLRTATRSKIRSASGLRLAARSTSTGGVTGCTSSRPRATRRRWRASARTATRAAPPLWRSSRRSPTSTTFSELSLMPQTRRSRAHTASSASSTTRTRTPRTRRRPSGSRRWRQPTRCSRTRTSACSTTQAVWRPLLRWQRRRRGVAARPWIHFQCSSAAGSRNRTAGGEAATAGRTCA
mmetsp:Transcript_17138/g.46411  ORF Transcript_17138/g.46411 Transcript_17138/m.46411 type:complete len:207 (-) Transcript_17138:1048-1668(-)